MAINSEIADGLTEMETDFPATFVWNSTSYTCLAGAESRAVGAGEFGLEQLDSLTLVVQLDQFGSGSKPVPTAIARQKIETLKESDRSKLNGYFVRIRYNDKVMSVPGCKAAGKHLEGDDTFCTLVSCSF